MTFEKWLDAAKVRWMKEFGEDHYTPFISLVLKDEYSPKISPELGILRVIRKYGKDPEMLATLEGVLIDEP